MASRSAIGTRCISAAQSEICQLRRYSARNLALSKQQRTRKNKRFNGLIVRADTETVGSRGVGFGWSSADEVQIASSEPEFGSIEALLRSRYPTHPRLTKYVRKLERAALVAPSDLKHMTGVDLSAHVPVLFVVALMSHLADRGSSAGVGVDLTPTMGMKCTEETVTLRLENQIPQLPPKYDPMLEEAAAVVEEEMIYVDELEVEVENDDDEEESAEESAEASEIIESAKSSDKTIASGEPLTLQLYDYRAVPHLIQTLWGKTSLPKLLKRKSYETIEARVRQMWRAGRNAVLLTGVPGVGKTAFLIYMLGVLMREYRPILLKTKDGTCYLYEPPERSGASTPAVGLPVGYRCHLMTNHTVLLDESVYFLVDGKLPDVPLFYGKALLTSTPLQDNYKEYHKDGRCARVVLPVWSAAEIALAWQEIFRPGLERGVNTCSEGTDEDVYNEDEDVDNGGTMGDEVTRAALALTLDIVKDRYKQWGGTPRYVLEKPHENLDEIVASIKSIQMTVEAVGKAIADGEHPSHKIAHLKVKPGYQQYDYMFASPYVTELALKKLKEETGSTLRAFLSFKGLAAHGLNGLKGNILEAEFKDLTIGKKEWDVRQLFADIKRKGRDKKKVFQFGNAFRGAFNLCSFPASALPANRIIWPESKTEGTFDAIKIVRRRGRQDLLELYQSTMSSERNKHGLKYEPVLKLMNHLGIPAARTRVYIATTSELYPKAGFQSWKCSGGAVLKDAGILKQLAGISQFALDTGI